MKAISIAILSLLIGWLCGSCSWGCGSPAPLPTPEIYVHDDQGQDLLDPSTPDYFNGNDILIRWINADGSIGKQAPHLIKQTTISPGLPYLPNGYRFSVNPFMYSDNNSNNGIIHKDTCVVFVQLSKSDTDTVTFVYSKATLQKFFYNKTLIAPPAPMTAYPATFPVIVVK